jgi:hypothetical protein
MEKDGGVMGRAGERVERERRCQTSCHFELFSTALGTGFSPVQA